MKWNEIFRKTARVYINFFLLVIVFHPFVELLLIIIQDQVYWRKWRCEKNTHTRARHFAGNRVKRRKSYTLDYWLGVGATSSLIVHHISHIRPHIPIERLCVCLSLAFLQMIYSWHIFALDCCCCCCCFHFVSVASRFKSIREKRKMKEKTNLIKWDKERLIFFHLTSEWKMGNVLFRHHHYAIVIAIAAAAAAAISLAGCTTFTNKWASCEPFRSFKNWNFRCSSEQITHTHLLGSSRSTPNHLLCENEFYWRELKRSSSKNTRAVAASFSLFPSRLRNQITIY